MPLPYRRIPPREEEWGWTEIARRAAYGRRAIYPEGALLGADIFEDMASRLLGLDDLMLLPPQFTPRRLEKAIELGREPTFMDVKTETVLGGFRVRLPLAMAAMGSTGVASRRALQLARGAARAGIVHVIGENVVTLHGYDKKTSQLPSFKERALAYLGEVAEGYGGLVIQQSVEDANYELWKRVYSDPDFDDYIRKGLVGFELKAGQGAKPGLGGEILVPREVALRLRGKFYFDEDPELVVKELYERHSVPGTYTEEILREVLRGMVNEYRSQARRVRVWLKTGPYRDLELVLRIAQEAGVDAVTVDGKEGGTGMSPSAALRSLGLPTLACLARIARARERGIELPILVAGGIRDGADLVKCLCLGASGVAMGRPFIVAVEGRYGPKERPLKALEKGEEGIVNFVEAIRAEVQLLVSSLGKYELGQLGREDLGALKREVASTLSLPYVYEPSTLVP